MYFLTFCVEAYFATLPTNFVDMNVPLDEPESEYPYIVLFYPVLRELETTMETTFHSLARLQYPKDRFRVVAIPNQNDISTVESLNRLAAKFSFINVLPIPATSDPSWNRVWSNWDANPKVYWWHRGKRAKVKDLPPKKTRQLIYAFYKVAEELAHEPNLLINYIDADSAPPADHFMAGARGIKHFDCLQSQNVAGNLLKSMASTWHAFDHMCWDGAKYVHLSAGSKQPYWVLGKGLFFRAKDLLELGGFHPWLTIEDPEVGMRFWKNGRRLGVINGSLIEEVPETVKEGITQRKRWVAGFLQSLGRPLVEMGFTPWERFKAWLIFLPCMTLWINALGVPIGIWALYAWLSGRSIIPEWTVWLSAFNIVAFTVVMTLQYISTWKRTKLVLDAWHERVFYMIRINPISAIIWWIIWLIPLFIGFRMYLLDEGLVWQRTEKIDANQALVRSSR
jgi:cellulose synthase/poly-beta-1,6-N-acetylglucosamine synthase-like glycosyltransferase